MSIASLNHEVANGITSTTKMEEKLKLNPDTALTHDEDIELLEQYKKDSIIYGEKGLFAYESWEEINELYFDNALKPIQIIWGITGYSHNLGNIDYLNNRILLHSSIYHPVSAIVWKTDKKMFGKKYTYDVILHEMIHQLAHQVKPEYKKKSFYTSHNNPFWCSEVVRIGSLLGYELKVVPQKLKRIDGKVKAFTPADHLTRQEFSTFPYSIREQGYYL